MIVVVNYGMANLRSVVKAIQFLGIEVKISDRASIIRKAKKLILPGVGHFGRAVKELKKRKIFSLIRDRIKDGVPFLGICLGMQLIFKNSQEAPSLCGLGLIEGEVKKFSKSKIIVPHMGWNQIKFRSPVTSHKLPDLFKGIKNGSFFYFAHSYYCSPFNKNVSLSTTHYGIEFTSSLHKENIWAVQFHPEKSQRLGIKLFKNFLYLC